MRDHAPADDRAVMKARFALYARMAQADNLEDAAKMICKEITDTGGVLNMPPEPKLDIPFPKKGVGPRFMVELDVHGLAVHAPSLLQAVETWMDTAGARSLPRSASWRRSAACASTRGGPCARSRTRSGAPTRGFAASASGTASMHWATASATSAGAGRRASAGRCGA